MTNKKSTQPSRRNFIKSTSLATAGFFIVPRHVLGRGFVAPSDKLNIAGIGAGGKGESDLAGFAKSPNANVIALCDVDDRQAVKSRAAVSECKILQGFPRDAGKGKKKY